jgi:hypothetical protein
MSYGPAPESAAPAQAAGLHGREFGLLLRDGQRRGAAFETLQSGEQEAAGAAPRQVQRVDRAVQAARAAQTGWWSLGGMGGRATCAGSPDQKHHASSRSSNRWQWQANTGVATSTFPSSPGTSTTTLGGPGHGAGLRIGYRS